MEIVSFYVDVGLDIGFLDGVFDQLERSVVVVVEYVNIGIFFIKELDGGYNVEFGCVVECCVVFCILFCKEGVKFKVWCF